MDCYSQQSDWNREYWVWKERLRFVTTGYSLFGLMFQLVNLRPRCSHCLEQLQTNISPNRDSNLNLPVLGSQAQHKTSALANYATESGAVVWLSIHLYPHSHRCLITCHTELASLLISRKVCDEVEARPCANTVGEAGFPLSHSQQASLAFLCYFVNTLHVGQEVVVCSIHKHLCEEGEQPKKFTNGAVVDVNDRTVQW
ncbi:unnamed protein product [Timema podura]|uniref:Uncharacterized protein n=1 Tax=Timema podura TaxID=61482 RepID=A0ABN7ND99_TIMPD|nr:unnamed protein product [Timema podura]